MNRQNQACGTQGPKLGQVQEQMNALDMAITELHDEVSRSMGNFEPVVNADPPNDKCGVGQPDVQLVRLADAIRSFRYRVTSARVQLASMNDRCEL